MADENTTSTNTGTGEGGSASTGSATDTGAQTAAQDGLGDAGKKALEEERRARKAAERSASSTQKQLEEMSSRLKEYEDAKKSDLDKLTERATTAEQTAASASAKLLRYEVAAAKKLPSEWAARLQGSTQEELEADADQLLEALGTQQQRQTPSYDGGVRQGAPAPTDMNSLIRQAAGRG